ncbi:MAG: ABC transporter permease subunit [Pseudomonadota bacterium]
MRWLANPFRGLAATYRRELAAYFGAPIAYVFIAIFLIALGLFTWEAASFFETGTADLAPFFVWHPWLYTIFLPALAMRLWADEQALGTDELLLSLPIGMPGLVFGKLLAAWTVAAAALACTLPMWVSVAYLGEPDHAAIAITYFMSLLMAGGYLAIGAAISALTSRQVLAFVIAVMIAFVFTAAGWPLILSTATSLLGPALADSLAQFSFLTHFDAAQRGVLELRSVLFFVGVIALFTSLNGLWATRRREP